MGVYVYCIKEDHKYQSSIKGRDDVFYQFSKDVKSLVSRKEIDREFYAILKRDSFVFARLYYYAVRFFGWIYW